MSSTLSSDNSGVNVMIEYLFSLGIMVILFSMMVLIVGNMSSTSDHIALREEYKIVANDIANRISAFSSQVCLNNKLGLFDSTVVSDESAYFDLPEPVQGKQYKIVIDTVPDTSGVYIVTASSVSDDTISWSATFQSEIPVQSNTFYCTAGGYEINYAVGNSPPSTAIIVGNKI